MTAATIRRLQRDIAACRICADAPLKAPLPHEPRPVCVLSQTARIAICGQAPGLRVHQSGRPFTDPSGDRLRDWMGVSPEVFYDASRIAIVPMGFCFPGYDRHGGDLPPRRECRLAWHDRIFAAMPQLELKIVIGGAAHAYHLGGRSGGRAAGKAEGQPAGQAKRSVTQTVRDWRGPFEAPDGACRLLPLPHPSWRNNAWIRKNPWFEAELLPVLRGAVRDLI
ncbi:MAG: uracil-DNA glycosylase family protein [Nitratireductor sp.]|nr:uracil-DNA glycosylase family protein [Nitratireductor sp.]